LIFDILFFRINQFILNVSNDDIVAEINYAVYY